jgi:hypothetical protein
VTDHRERYNDDSRFRAVVDAFVAWLDNGKGPPPSSNDVMDVVECAVAMSKRAPPVTQRTDRYCIDLDAVRVSDGSKRCCDNCRHWEAKTDIAGTARRIGTCYDPSTSPQTTSDNDDCPRHQPKVKQTSPDPKRPGVFIDEALDIPLPPPRVCGNCDHYRAGSCSIAITNANTRAPDSTCENWRAIDPSDWEPSAPATPGAALQVAFERIAGTASKPRVKRKRKGNPSDARCSTCKHFNASAEWCNRRAFRTLPKSGPTCRQWERKAGAKREPPSATRHPCGDCIHRNGDGVCAVYGRPVDAGNVKPCREFSPDVRF